MLQVYWKIGRKPRGNWLTPLTFQISFMQSRELELNVHFVFQKDYLLQDSIYCTQYSGRRGNESAACRKLDRLSYNFNVFVSAPYSLYPVQSLNSTACSSNCKDCRIYLPWRPGLADYSDFEEIFRQVAYDLTKAWNDAVAEAMTSEEFDMEPVTILSSDYIFYKEETTTPSQKATRKIKM